MGATLDEILAIPGNQVVYDRLRTLLKEGSATAFVGAGASYPLFPLWPQLIQKLVYEPVSRGLANETDKEYWLRTAGPKPLQVAWQIRQKLGDALYYTFLHETFKDQSKPFTPTHEALMRMNFRAWVTTNYDSGLVEAGRLNQFTIWNQNYAVADWMSGDVFKTNKPVLYAHGHFSDPANVVLDRESYRRAYQQGPYRRLFENLWLQHHLVFVGFSFNDVTLGAIAEEVLWQMQATSVRHIAIMGMEADYTPEMRREFLDPAHTEVLFYPVRDHDHSALRALLESLVTSATAPTPPSIVKPVGRLVQQFVHETTEDEKFTGRVEQLARLNRWAVDPKVRLIAITGMGGLGKTALLGHWLRESGRSVFFWSFYRDQDSDEFFRALSEFRGPGIIALDGLEVIQEVPGTVAYGKLLDLKLAEFLHERCRTKDGSLVVLTSRFPFPDLTQYAGRGLQLLPLPSLDDGEGADLLDRLGLLLGREDREEVSRRLEGHPLALRIYARAGQPEVSVDGPLEAKMRHLLEFYEKRIPEVQRQTLSLVALFRMPVDEATLVPLWEKLLSKRGSPASVLAELHREHLLTLDPGRDGRPRYACHPILRDHFRALLLSQRSLAREAANLLAGPPDAKAKTLEEVQVVSMAVELLLEVGDVTAANDLYTSRLNAGWIFSVLPAPHWGMEIGLAFVRAGVRREALVRGLTQGHLAFYLSDVGMHARMAGQPDAALEFYAQAGEIYRRKQDKNELSIILLNVATTEITVGMLVEATGHVAEAIQLAIEIDDDRQRGLMSAYGGLSSSLRGDVTAANLHFAQASSIENKLDQADSYSRLRIIWAEHLIRTGNESRAQQLTRANFEICERNGWRADNGVCRWLLGWLDTLSGLWLEAHSHLDDAKSVFTRGHMIYELARTLLTECLCFLGEGRLDTALSSCERALDLAAPRNYRLVHADALNLRARIALARNDHSAARDDAELALQVAQYCEYAWGQRDSAEILASAYRALDDPEAALRYQLQFEDWRRRLTA